ncbi:tetratricopeptide repeat protein [Aquabacter sp. L1I39]|uniref:tetratricopeptide repeat protein n=1 Tax=Aquabacter sp. L1I39 TaxID=2820278 RepID=UPI001ADA623A|nr:tetratricopeptide repeat protein [Aquabacter sp. L1I39]QTL05743.1 tetratricopeptide repeat protein [Aquabacter sp. L1I39]
MSQGERHGAQDGTCGAAPGGDATLSPADLVKRGDDLLKQGQPALAERLFTDALDRDPGQLRAYLQLASLASDRGDTDAALAFLEAGLARKPASPALRHAKAKALRHAGRFSEAREAISPLLDQQPPLADLILQAADLARLDGKLEEAGRLLRGLGLSVKGAAGEAVRLARAYRDAKRMDEARTLMKETHEACPQDKGVLNLYADLLATAGAAADPQAFETVLALRLADEPPHLRTLLALAEHRIAQGRSEEGSALLAQANAAHPEAPQPYLKRAALLREADAKAALAIIEAGLARLPLHEALAREKARILTALARDEEAEQVLRSVLDSGRASEKFASALGLDLVAAIRRQGRLDEARQKLGTDFATEAHAREGLRLVNDLRAAGRTADALAVIRLILERHPRDINTLLALAAILQRKEAYGEAEDVVRQILKIDPTHGRAYAVLADIQGRKESAAAALATLDLGFALGPPKAELYATSATILFNRGEDQAGWIRLKEGLEHFPTHRTLLRLAIDQSIASGRFGDMEPRLALLPDTAEERSMRHVFRAKAALARLQFDEADPALAAAEREAPDNHYVFIHQLVAAMPRLRMEEARRARRFLRHLVRNGDPDQVHSAHRVLGFYSEVFNDLLTDPAATVAGNEALARNDLDRLCEVARDFPDSTGLAVALVVALRRAGRLPGPKPSRAGEAFIPRLVHQFWDTPDIPKDLDPFIESWQTINPGWTYRRYDIEAAAKLLAERMPAPVLSAFHAARHPAHKADIFRLAVLLLQGGVYADIDDRCTGPLHQLCARATLVLRHENLGSIGNNFMACRPGHPLIGKALLGAVKATLEGHSEAIWLSTGPGLITRTFAQLYAGDAAVRSELEAQTHLLPDFVLRNFVACGLRAVYKSTDKHWVQRDFGGRSTTGRAETQTAAAADGPAAPLAAEPTN